MARVTNQAVFATAILPEGKTGWKFMGAGVGLEVLALSALIILPMLFPEKMTVVRHYFVMPIEAPHVEAWKPQPVKVEKPLPVKKVVPKPAPKPVEVAVVEPPKPKIYTPVISSPIAKPVVKKKQDAPDMTQVAKAFPTDPITMGSSAIPNLKKPREAVQTGGFGDPDGLKGKPNPNKAANVAQMGGYDMPAGPGVGNGTGGAKGARGVVASTGFGNEVAAGSKGGPRGVVQPGGFGDQVATAGPHVKQTAAVSNTKPVEIISKPKPAYTDEARTKKVEGEVLLRVVFTASGEVKVEKVERGLGYGLDESAEASARQIRFHPALQEGQPVDSTAIVHIVFELAY
jgi:TonB family protein